MSVLRLLGRLATLLAREDLGLVLFTVEAALVATALLFPFGVALAWALARGRGPAWLRTLVETLVSLPLVLPPTAVGLLLLELLQRRAPLGRLLARLDVDLLFTPKAVVLATATMALPLLVRSARTAFEEIDPRLLAVARTLGATPVAAFARVALPLAWRGLVAGALLSFSRALGEFGATILLAGNIPGRTQTIALAIYSRAEGGDDAGALRLVAFATAIAFLAVATTELLLRRRSARGERRR